MTSLNGLLARATGDFSEQFEVPKSLLEHLDQIDANNPELYKTKRIKEAIQSTEKFNEKLQYLEVSYDFLFVHFCVIDFCFIANGN